MHHVPLASPRDQREHTKGASLRAIGVGDANIWQVPVANEVGAGSRGHPVGERGIDAEAQ